MTSVRDRRVWNLGLMSKELRRVQLASRGRPNEVSGSLVVPKILGRCEGPRRCGRVQSGNSSLRRAPARILGRGRSSSAGSAHAQMLSLCVGCQEYDCAVKRETACVSRKQQLIFVIQRRIMIVGEKESIDFNTLGA